jgi:ribosome-binding factor A
MDHAPKPYKRNVRVSELVRNELAKLVLRDVELTGGIITIMDVDVTEKLDYARVKVSVLPSSKAKEALGLLQGAAGHLQHDLLRKINIKPMPYLQFMIDDGVEAAANLEKVFIEGERQGKMDLGSETEVV